MPAVKTLPAASVLGKRGRGGSKSATSTPSATPAAKRIRSVLLDNTDENENPFNTPRKVIGSSPFLDSVQRSVIRHNAASHEPVGLFDHTGQSSFDAVSSLSEQNQDLLLSPIRRTRKLAGSATRVKTSLRLQIHIDPVAVDTPPTTASPQTPRRAARTVSIKPTKVPSTPRHRVLISGKPLTPRSPATPGLFSGLSVPSTPRSAALQHPPIEIYRDARQLFIRSVQSVELVGRETELETVQTFIAPRLKTRTSGCLYVSGPPGTGKTAFLTATCRDLAQTASTTLAVVNCMGIRSGKDLAMRFLQAFNLDGGDILEGQEMNVLKRKFHLRRESNLVILDEIDHLLDVDLDFMYTVFEWALEHEQKATKTRRPTSNLVLVGIANALDFTDRFLPKLKARSIKPTLLPFTPYSAEQITRIITAKLRSLLPEESRSTAPVPFIQAAAISFLSKKVAAQTGDLRRAFDLARAAIDAIETDTRAKLAAANPFASRMLSPLKKKVPLGETAEPMAPRQPSSATLSATSDYSTPIFTVDSAPKATISHMARITAAAFTNNGPTARIRSLNLQQKSVLCALTSATLKQQQMHQPTLKAIGEDDENNDPEAAFHSLLGTPSRHTFSRAPASRARTPSAPSTPSKKSTSHSSSITVSSLYSTYSALCKLTSQLAPLSSTEFGDVLSSLEAASLLSIGDGVPIVGATGPMTPSRRGRSAASVFEGLGAGAANSIGRDDWMPVSLIANVKDVREVCLEGPGDTILRRILDGTQ